MSRIAVTDDCALLSADFGTLFPSCFEIPEGAVVLQMCGCASGGLKIWTYDSNTTTWYTLAKEFAVGVNGDFVDNNNPTASELNALFGGTPSNDALVVIRPTKEFWASKNCGATWLIVDDVPTIGADVEQTGFQSYNQIGRETVPFEWYDEVIYANGESTTFPIAENDLLDITVVYGYVIDEFADATNAQDDAIFRIRLSGPFPDESWYMGLPTGNMLIRNGLAYATFNIKKIATQAGNLRLRISFSANGTTPTGPQDWEFTAYCDRTSVSISRGA